jgi:hypothetical protein
MFDCMEQESMDLSEVISVLRRLSQPVPKPFRLPSEEEVAVAEDVLGVSFHRDYKRFLLEASDVVHGTLEPAMVTPGTGHRDLIQMAKAAWEEDGVPRNLLPFCFDNGNYFCMSEMGEVVYWDHNGSTNEKWSNLAIWIKHVWIEGG